MTHEFIRGDRVKWKPSRYGPKRTVAAIGTVVGFCRDGGILVTRDGMTHPHPRLPAELEKVVDDSACTDPPA